jgi:hypothetical protein
MKNKSSLLLLLCTMINITLFAQDTTQIKAVFNQFQAGYSKRDTSLAGKFATDLFSNNISIIGTGTGEWSNGLESAKKLVKNDWLYWLNLQLDLEKIQLQLNGNTAVFAVKGTSSISFPNKDIAYNYVLQQLQQATAEEKNAKAKMLIYAAKASEWVKEIEIGGLEAIYEIRVSGVLFKQNGKWLFQQIVFSYPNPMKRIFKALTPSQ